ncbi:alkanesulfonate monooxygenase [Sphaerisporangium krabiense]|uniref:Alkanesulfonate monooxygenase n=1 Tax=Sphaerisporangium krabiense TaxID=763782 RepID=A0A7W8Z898_9ACTN|nr:LLM class flavin-dependent oxidoreductase [Sphaerisporangium krabiense]MBB5628933.1 alkanesulfonate monooxygenase [Sphaerisporangium krabiense]GII60226.1 alkanesulfonate monooxygenase [Sphaerisporangium krabiense]
MTETPEFLVTVPTRGDGRHPLRRDRGDWEERRPLPAFVTDPRGGVSGPSAHIAQVGRAAEIAGLDGALVPFDPEGEESLVLAAGLLRGSRHLRVIAGFHAGIATPVYAAKLSASLQRFTGGRLDWQIDVALDPVVARAHGDFLQGGDRYARAEEFLTVAKGVWHEEGYTYEGVFYQVLAGGFQPPNAGLPFPRVHLSGIEPGALALSARHADVHLFDPGQNLDVGIAGLGDRAAAEGRAVAYGLRLPVLAREDEEEAWREARGLWALAGGADEDFPRPDPKTGLWPGFDRIAGPGALGLVGSYEGVAAGIRAYRDLGVTTFVLSARPTVEEAYRLGERLLPLFATESQKETAHVH